MGKGSMKKTGATKKGDTAGKSNLPGTVPQIDYLKGFAIIAVILLHALPLEFFLLIGSPFHLWHAVPLFILVAGFTGAYAYKRYGADSLSACYSPALMIRRYRRLLIPFIICWIIELVMLFSVNQLPTNIIQILIDLVKGGYGWGAYFIPVILQSVLVVPLLYLLAKRSPNRMIIFALAASLLFDALIILLGWDESVTSVIYFRFLFAGALGVWIVTSTKIETRWLALGGLVSLAYLAISCYTPWFSGIPGFSSYAGVLETPAFMWTVMLALAGLRYFPKHTGSRVYFAVGEMGKASWHIFLAQLIYYFLPAEFVYVYIITPICFDNMVVANILIVIVNLGICLSLGYAWYVIENKFLIKKRINSPSS